MKQRRWWFGLAAIALLGILTPVLLMAAPPGPVTTNHDSVAVLCYHRVLATPASVYDFTPAQLEQQLKYLKDNGYQTLTAVQFLELQKKHRRIPAKSIVLTFDDGHRSHYTEVFPLLKKYGFVATFFVVPQVIAENSTIQLTWNELNEMAVAGMDIQSHTMNHPFLTSIKEGGGEANYLNWLERELKGSKTLIEEKLHRSVTILAYPYGWYNELVEKLAVKAGYEGIHTVNWGVNEVDANPLRVRRRVMENTMGLPELERLVNSRPLRIQIMSPGDSVIVKQLPLIQFKIADPGIGKVEIQVRNYRMKLEPDLQGIFHFGGITELKSGYCMIIITGYDAEGRRYVTSWGFDYQKPETSQ